MNRRALLPFLLFACLPVFAAEPATRPKPATAPSTSPWGVKQGLVGDPALPHVLLIGDSILNGSHAPAAELLRGKVNLDIWVTPKHVGGMAGDLKAILAEHTYDLIFFNDIGLHAWQPGRIPEGQYERLLRAHLTNLATFAPKAKLIFATTTPIVTKAKPFALDAEKNPIIAERNPTAVKVMEEKHIPVADFYETLVTKLELSAGDGFHWTKPAYGLIARVAITRIADVLGFTFPDAPATPIAQ